MGDGPGYDARDRQIDEDDARRRKRLRSRQAMLRGMQQTVGFGDSEAETRLEKLAAQKLQEASDLIDLILRAG